MRKSIKLILCSLIIAFALLTCKSPSGSDDPDTTEQQYELTVELSPDSAGSVTPDGGSYVGGSNITLEATSKEGWQFDSWSGAVSSSENPIDLTLNSDISVTANFKEAQGADAFVGEMTVESGNMSRLLVFFLGDDNKVKKGLDEADVESPPFAPPNTFFTGFKHNKFNLYYDYRPRTKTTDRVVWNLLLNRPEGSNMSLSWDFPASVDNGELAIVDNPDVSDPSVNIDMLSNSNYTVSDPSIDNLYIVYSVSQKKEIITNSQDTIEDKKSRDWKLDDKVIDKKVNQEIKKN